MNIRDNIVVCGYCGGKIAKETEKSPSGAGEPETLGGSTGQKGTGAKSTPPRQDEPETGEDEGGLSVYLQPGEQVLIGSLNIAVKKFFFHAYLSNQRIFLIDTQEKKVRVTAKDIPRDTIAGSIIEYSESSDPVLVLSLKSADDEIKTMKLIFIQNGMDRSDEIDEWVSLLQEQVSQKKIPVQAPEEIPEPPEEPKPVQAEKPLQKQELQPKRKPGKGHEKQPPVKRHILFHTIQEQEEEPEVEETPRPPRRPQVREVPEPAKKPVIKQESEYEFSTVKKADTSAVRKYEVQSAMKVAMKSAMQPLKHSSLQASKRPVTEPVPPPLSEPEPADTEVSPGRPPLQKKTPVQDDVAETPPFCQNCGKKIPPTANFCPGCGTKLGTHRGAPEYQREIPSEKKATHHEAPVREKKGATRDAEIDETEKDDEVPVPTKPPAKKVPKGSEMTILHKFLRR